MNYQKFITEVLKIQTIKPTKSQMQFAYVVLYCGFGLSIEKSIKESISI
jgi:hypothetical protein